MTQDLSGISQESCLKKLKSGILAAEEPSKGGHGGISTLGVMMRL